MRTFHLSGGEPGFVAKARTAARGRAARSKGDTVTTPATGVLAAADIEEFTYTTTFQIMQSLRL